MSEPRTLYVESNVCDWHESGRCTRHPEACIAGCLDDEQHLCGWEKVPATVDDLPEVKAVIEAWIIEGPHPDHHRRWKENLRCSWPTLAGAIDGLVAALEETDEY